MRNSIRPTFDSRTDGLQYWVSSRVGDRPVCVHEPIPDPFIRHTVRVSWRHALRELVRRRCVEVTVMVGAPKDRVDDVLELDADTLIGGSTRRAAWGSHLNEAMGRFLDEEP